jgi:hypothetical protein
VRYWTSTSLGVNEIRRRAMLYFGREATPDMSLVAREPDRLLFSDPFGDLAVEVQAGQPNRVGVITTHWHGQALEFLRDRAAPRDGLIHYETESARSSAEVLQRARDYFGQGPEGLGLSLSAEQPQALEFAGGGGHVTVAVQGDGRPTVRIAAREWTYQAERFVRQVSSER